MLLKLYHHTLIPETLSGQGTVQPCIWYGIKESGSNRTVESFRHHQFFVLKAKHEEVHMLKCPNTAY